MNGEWFPILRTITFVFASLMLFKYFVFLIIAPFYPVKESLRRLKALQFRSKYPFCWHNPKVSIIIPAWNEEVGVVKSINSLLKNTYQNIEILVVNDGSIDRTGAVIQRYIRKLASKYPDRAARIKYVLKRNGGKGTALNSGIRRASGEIIVTMDADSIFDSQAIANLVRYFQDPSINAVVGNVKVANNSTLIGYLQKLEYLFGFYFKRAHAVLGAEYIFGGACAAFRRSQTFDIYGLFDATNKTEDIEMSMRLRYHGIKCTFAEDVICYTEGASSVLGLINQRLRWKKGRFDTFIKYRRMFFSLDPRHNWFLSWFILPFSMLAEIQLLFEPIAIMLLIAYSFISGDYLSLSLGSGFIFVIYLVNALFSHERLNLRLIVMFTMTWILFYILVWIEYLALLKSIGMIIRGEEVVWQTWQRKGVALES